VLDCLHRESQILAGRFSCMPDGFHKFIYVFRVPYKNALKLTVAFRRKGTRALSDCLESGRCNPMRQSPPGVPKLKLGFLDPLPNHRMFSCVVITLNKACIVNLDFHAKLSLLKKLKIFNFKFFFRQKICVGQSHFTKSFCGKFS
jgi:hypothetical protein